MKPLSRKEREYQARRDDILNAAERIFARNGFHKSTVAEIARESEFAIGTLYQFFANKETLYYTMMIEKFNRLHAMLQEAVATRKDFMEELHCLVETVLAFIEQNVDFFKIFTWELNVLRSSMEGKLKEELIAKHFAYIELISNVVQKGMRRGALAAGSAGDLSVALVGMMNVFSFNWILNNQQEALKEKAPLIVNLFLHGAVRSPNAR